MDQNLTVHWHSCWTMLCDLQEATLTNTKRKITIAWCPDHVVCRTRSAHAVTPSGMLFSEQKSQEFCGPYFASGRRTWLRAASTDTGTAQQHRDVRGDLGHTTFETVRGSLTRRAADEGRLGARRGYSCLTGSCRAAATVGPAGSWSEHCRRSKRRPCGRLTHSEPKKSPTPCISWLKLAIIARL